MMEGDSGEQVGDELESVTSSVVGKGYTTINGWKRTIYVKD